MLQQWFTLCWTLNRQHQPLRFNQDRRKQTQKQHTYDKICCLTYMILSVLWCILYPQFLIISPWGQLTWIPQSAKPGGGGSRCHHIRITLETQHFDHRWRAWLWNIPCYSWKRWIQGNMDTRAYQWMNGPHIEHARVGLLRICTVKAALP